MNAKEGSGEGRNGEDLSETDDKVHLTERVVKKWVSVHRAWSTRCLATAQFSLFIIYFLASATHSPRYDAFNFIYDTFYFSKIPSAWYHWFSSLFLINIEKLESQHFQPRLTSNSCKLLESMHGCFWENGLYHSVDLQTLNHRSQALKSIFEYAARLPEDCPALLHPTPAP